HKRQTPVTSQNILQYAIKLKMFVERSNVLSINQDIVFHKLQTLLSEHHLNILLLENNKELIHQFIQQVLRCMQPLTSSSIQTLLAPLQKLAAKEESLLEEIHSFNQKKKREAFWHQYKFVVVLIIAFLLCLLM